MMEEYLADYKDNKSLCSNNGFQNPGLRLYKVDIQIQLHLSVSDPDIPLPHMDFSVRTNLLCLPCD